MLSKLKKLYIRTIYISKLTNVKLKKLRIVMSVVFSNISVGLEILIIIIFSTLLTDQVSFENKIILQTIDLFIDNPYLLLVIIFLRFLFLFLEKYNIESLSLEIHENLRHHVMSEVFSKGNMSTSDSFFYINQVCAHVSYFYRSLSTFLNTILQVAGYGLFLSFYNLEVFSTFIFGSFLIAIPSRFLIKQSKHYQHLSFSQAKDVDGLIQRIIDNSFLIKILKTSNFELENFRTNLRNYKDYQLKNIVFGSLNSILPAFFALSVLAIIFGFFDISNAITLEFVAILLRLFQNLSSFNNALGLVINSSVHVEELYNLDTTSPKLNTNNYIYVENEIDSVQFKNVSFSYLNSNEVILENIDLNFKKNKHTIITGPNGSGKSTLLGLISGLYIPSSGTVNISSNKLGYIGVTPLVFDGSIKENLMYGNNKTINDDEILDLVSKFSFYSDEKQINLNEKITNKSLSSGQLQKISFIRAILNDSDILLLDEATSNLDSYSKKLIFEILSEKNMTIINSTHNKDDFQYDYELNIFTNGPNKELILKQINEN